MPSSKGEPDNPELREKVKEEVKAMSKGGGPGSWSAWKAGELARRYEAKGGGYKDTGDNKNKAQPGAPEKKEKKDGSSGGGAKKDEKKEKEEESKDDKKEESGGGKKKDDGGDSGKAAGGSSGKSKGGKKK